MAIAINTHAASQGRKAAGADPKLAEAIVKTVGQADAQLAIKARPSPTRTRADRRSVTAYAGAGRRKPPDPRPFADQYRISVPIRRPEPHRSLTCRGNPLVVCFQIRGT